MGKRWNGCGSQGMYCIPSSLFSPLMSPSKRGEWTCWSCCPWKQLGSHSTLRQKQKPPLVGGLIKTFRCQCLCWDFEQAGDGIWTETFVSQDLGWHHQFISCWPQNNHHLIKTFIYCQWLVNLWRFAWDKYQFSCQTLSELSEPLMSKRIGLEISSDKDLLCDSL